MTHEIFISIATLTAIADPLGALTIYLTFRQATAQRRYLSDAWRVAFAVWLCLIISAVMGTLILRAFSVELAGLRTAGGVILLSMAYYMVQGERPGSQFSKGDRNAADGEKTGDLSLYVPFAIPLIAGPGAIATAITLPLKPGVELAGALIAIAVVSVLVFFTIYFAQFWRKLLGEFGLRLLTRLLGLLVMAVGIQMTVLGVKALWQ